MDCRELQPGGPTDPAGSGAAGTRELLSAIDQLRAVYRAPSELPAATRRAHLEVLQTLLRAAHDGHPNGTTEPVTIHHARHFIAKHLTEALTVKNVAKHVGLCPQHFRKRFKQATNLTPGRYLTQRRVEHAKTLLLNPEQKVIALALDAGFQSVPTFYRAFRHHTGQSPTEYRHRLTHSVMPRTRAAANRS